MNWLDILKTLSEWAATLDNAHNELATLIAKMMTFMIVPNFLVLNSDEVAHNLGAVVGFSQAAMIFVMIVIATIMMWPSGNHGRRLGQVFSSIWMMGIFIVGFYPLVNLVQVGLGILRNAVLYVAGVPQDKFAAKINEIAQTPLDPYIRFNQIFVMIVLGFIMLAMLVFLAAALIALVFLFPLSLVLRPLGGFWDKMFHILLSGIPVILLSPLFMTICVLAPQLIGKYIPLGDTAIAQFLAVTVAYLTAILVPGWLWSMAYQKSVQVHGKIETTIRDKVDIGSLPKPSWEQAQHDGNRAAESPLKAFMGSVTTGAAAAAAVSGGDGDALRSSFKHLLADGVSAAATVMGHPYIGAAVQGLDSMSKTKEAKQANAVAAEQAAAQAAAQTALTAQAVAAAVANTAAQTPPLPQQFTTGHEAPQFISSRKG